MSFTNWSNEYLRYPDVMFEIVYVTVFSHLNFKNVIANVNSPQASTAKQTRLANEQEYGHKK